jgi:hypothetical protein
MRKQYKVRAIALRRKGKTYREILLEVPVAKSTLSAWFREVELSTPQKQRLTQKRKDAAMRGAEARRINRLAEVTQELKAGLEEVRDVTGRELWLIGIALYWAEGSKQNERSPSEGLAFGNSDYRMLAVYLAWLRAMKIEEKDIIFELYVHRDREQDSETFRKWWVTKLGISTGRLTRVYLKNGNPKTNRQNVGDLYHGLLRIKVKTSTTLNRRIQGWIAGVVESVVK